MRALRYHGPGDIRLEDVDEPEVGPGQVKLRIAYNGICGSDLHEYYTGPTMVPVSAPNPVTGVQAPVVIGHECGGTVVAVGEGVNDVTPGTLVAVEPIQRCGRCRECVAGRYNLCSRMAAFGYTTGYGGLAEYTVVDRVMVHPLPVGFSEQQSAVIEPLAVAYHAARRAEVLAGQTVVVHGAGPVGLGTALTARHFGAEVIVVDPSPNRRALVEALGGTTVLDPGDGDLVAAIRDLTDGRGAEASIDAAGAASALRVAVESTAKEGSIVLVGVHHKPLELAAAPLMMGEIDVRFSMTYRGDFPLVIEAMAAGAYPLDGWVSTVPIGDAVEKGFEALRNGGAMKILVDPAA
ncbi:MULTISPECIES: 2,3-butanediol dehydrogenase [Streptomyces]|uniref:2,3-butanediol dehydrogenase n=1 Tax=Streptomyces lycopersici TaxID=2974589 RepID=UPI0021CE48C6|nr:2,3-butanediol dehydrogenase [Streptomyces sp. NEAU-383]